MLSLEDLKIKVNNFYQKINDPVYIQTVLNNHPTTFTKTVWSKDMAFSLAPLGLELLGFRGSKYLIKKPNTIKYLYEYKLVDDMIREVLVHDKAGFHIQTDYIYRDDDSVFELSLDLTNTALSITAVSYSDDRIVSSLRVDSDQEFWYNEYIYDEGRIKKIASRQKKSNNGEYVGILEVDYIDHVVANIYHFHLGKKCNYYTYK
jgi:hypothetical protein